MVRVFKKDIYSGDYGLTGYIETNFGLIVFQTNFPRLNKWITIKSICSLEIQLGTKIDYFGDTRVNIRNPQAFIHKLLMTVKDSVVYNLKTEKIIEKYREINEDGLK